MMVAESRFDLFPRGINEVFNEYAARHGAIPNLAIEKHLLIYYPWPTISSSTNQTNPLQSGSRQDCGK